MIVATAGHVDHGKTSLVRQLTGVDTDRLEEEKRRGLSINLGFAYSRGAGVKTIGFIDVPGHNRFINNMIAGVRGIDMGMLVVAADDGPMPQTHEHLAVMRLLGVKDFVLVITKIDRVEKERVAEVHDSVKALLSVPCPIFAVDAIQGSGVAELKHFLHERAEQLGEGSVSGYFRLSVDRAFLLKGTGLILTGTAMSGQASIGDTLMLSPQGTRLRIRTIHAQDSPVDSCKAGQRCALNVMGDIEIEQINRGDYLVHETLAVPTSRFDARFHLLPSAPFGLKHLSPVKLYIGATRKRAKLYLLQKQKKGNKIGPGENALVQLLIEGEIACCSGDRFVIRDDSESVTLGGGMVLDAHSARMTKTKFPRLCYLAAMELDSTEEKVRALLIEYKQVLNLGRFTSSWNIRDEELGKVLLDPALDEKIKLFDWNGTDFAVATQAWADADQILTKTLASMHQEKPKDIGILLKDLNARLAANTEPDLYEAVIIAQQKSGLLKISNGLVTASNHQNAVSLEADRQWSEVELALTKHGNKLPVISNLQQSLAYDEPSLARILDTAQKNGKVICLGKNRLALPSVLFELADSVTELSKLRPQFTIKEFKDVSGLSRNLAVEVLEYFDSIGLTEREGDRRSVINADVAEKFFKPVM